MSLKIKKVERTSENVEIFRSFITPEDLNIDYVDYDILKKDQLIFYFCYYNDTVVGVIMVNNKIKIRSKYSIYIEIIAVDKKYRKSDLKIGSFLINWLKENYEPVISVNNKKYIFESISCDSLSISIGFYKKMGFNCVDNYCFWFP